MTPRQRRQVLDELRTRTHHERKQLEAGLFQAMEIAADANLEVGDLFDMYEAVRSLIGERAGRRPRYRQRRFASHE